MIPPRKILVVDIGGSHVKCLATGRPEPASFVSGRHLTPGTMMRKLRRITRGWRYEAVSIGYPGVVRDGRIAREPHHLGAGWVGFDFEAAFQCPARIVNDAAMQALGSYDGGKMLFLGLGTGLGSALIANGEVLAMELGHLQFAKGRTYEDVVGDRGRKRLGARKWRARVAEVVEGFRQALLPDYIVLGGGNARRLDRLASQTRRGNNAYAFRGGFRLWDANFSARPTKTEAP